MRPLTLISLAVLVLAAVSFSNGHRCYSYHSYHGYRSRCCRLKNYYRRLYWKYRRQCRAAFREIKKLRAQVEYMNRTIALQQLPLIQVPPEFQPLTRMQFNRYRTRAISILTGLTYNNGTTTPTPSLPPTTTTPMKTTRRLPTAPSPEPTGVYNGKRKPVPQRDSPASLLQRLFEKGNLDDLDVDFDEEDGDEEQEDFMDEDEEQFGRRRKRRMTETTCPTGAEVAGTFAQGTTAIFVTKTNTHESLGSRLARACIECRYLVTLPEGFVQRFHQHVVCPSTKQNCFGGFAKCVKNEMRLDILQRDAAGNVDLNNARQFVFNKACSCNLHSIFANALGDGN